MERFDVVVIGGGIAGAAAALAAATAGATVVVVRRGPAATALSHGGWIDAPPTQLSAALATAGLEIRTAAGALPHPDGILVSCAAAASSHADAILDDGSLICGVAGLPGFHAASLAALWSDEAGRSMRAVTIELPGTPAAGWSPVALAAMIERDPARIAVPLREVARGADRVILPAVLGLHDHTRAREAVSAAAGAPVAEALGAAPSIPGWRLDHALLRALTTAGVHVRNATATGSDITGNVLTRVNISSDVGQSTIVAGSAVLATGKFLGGGITANEEFEESALGCDVAFERFTRTIDDPAAALLLTDPVRTGHQVVLTAGVRVGPEGHPLAAGGDALARNVFAAGAVRAGIDTARLGLGSAALDGWAAGERAAAAVGRMTA